MDFVKKRRIGRSRTMQRGFLGYCPQLSLGDARWYEEENLSSRAYPYLRPRARRRKLRSDPIGALGYSDGLVTLSGRTLRYGEEEIDLPLSHGEKSLRTFGAYILILPDLVWVNTVDGSFGACELREEFHIPVGIRWCDREGRVLDNLMGGTTPPGNTECHWVDLSGERTVIHEYSREIGKWVPIEPSYIRISGEGIGGNFPKGTRILVEDCPDLAPLVGTGLLTVYDSGRDHVVVEGIIPGLLLESEPIQFRLAAPMPIMDHLIHHENRLWGCRYGLDHDGNFVNEIYASALGDFTKWYSYRGIASDSYGVSIGDRGPFTGAAVVGGYPVFFKEHSIHKVYGSKPASYQVRSTPATGIAPGSEKSIGILEDSVIYLGSDGFYIYDGSLPVKLSRDLEGQIYRSGVGAVHSGIYYCSVLENGDTPVVLTYDTLRKVWHRETGIRPKEFLSANGILYYRTEAPGLFAMGTEEGTPAEEAVAWEGVTGILREDKPDPGYFTGLRLRLSMEAGSHLQVFGEFDSKGVWEPLGSVTRYRLGSETIVFPIRRCDHLRLKLKGKGDVTVHSLTFTMEG